MNIYEACNWLKDFEMPPRDFIVIDGANPKKEIQYKALLTLISAAKNGELTSRELLDQVREKRDKLAIRLHQAHVRNTETEADKEFTERFMKARQQICDEFCKYTHDQKHGKITQEALNETCEYDCPLSKL